MTKEKKPQALQATSISDIKAKIQANHEGIPVELPSGLVFRLKKPSIARLMQENVFPNELVSAAIKMDSQNFQAATREEYLQYLQVIDTVVKYSCVVPRIAESEEQLDDNSILAGDIDDMDRVAIFMYAQTGVAPQRKFRTEQQDTDAGPSLPAVS